MINYKGIVSMTRDEIYDHLAKVYLGKRESVSPKKRNQSRSIARCW